MPPTPAMFRKAKTAPGWLQEVPRGFKWPPKQPQGGPKSWLKCIKMPWRGAKVFSKGQDGSQMAQRGSQEGPKRDPMELQVDSRELQVPPKCAKMARRGAQMPPQGGHFVSNLSKALLLKNLGFSYIFPVKMTFGQFKTTPMLIDFGRFGSILINFM